MVTMRAGLAAGLAAAAFALGGCVGYDGGSDGASLAAQSLGLTAKEEETIRGALAQKALTADEIAKLERELGDGSGLPGEWRTTAITGDAMGRNKRDGSLCGGDINCASRHCDQSGICMPASAYKAVGIACTQSWECASNRCSATAGATGGSSRFPWTAASAAGDAGVPGPSAMRTTNP